MASFDPDAAAAPGSGIFGLPTSPEEARVILIPVPFDATTSYRRGTAGGPRAILEASRQVDLFDREVGRPYQGGIAMLPISSEIEQWNEEASRAADPIIAAGGASDALAANLAAVNGISERLNARVHETTREWLSRGKLTAVVGGDHSTPYGAIQATSELHRGLGVLHVDAHADLRDAYEGFTHSHASIMRNVLTSLDGVAKLVQVGVRDFGEEEDEFRRSCGDRVSCHFDADLARARVEGEAFGAVAGRVVAALPPLVYISFDIDGLDPVLCPHTGTPVPGGLSWHEATYLIGAVVRSGRKIVGFDLNEVAPGPEGDEWDANVGARLLYKLIGWALKSWPSQDKTKKGPRRREPFFAHSVSGGGWRLREAGSHKRRRKRPCSADRERPSRSSTGGRCRTPSGRPGRSRSRT